MRRYVHGWYQVAYRRDLTDDVVPVSIGPRRLIIVKRGEKLAAFDAHCPHRGAHLGHGGTVSQDAIVCPFHGLKIALGKTESSPFAIREYRVLDLGGLVFVRLSEQYDNGWPSMLEKIAAENTLIPAIEMKIRAPMETVIENALDARHFWCVHQVRTDEFSLSEGPLGELEVASRFYIPAYTPGATASGDLLPAHYNATIVSPGVAIVELQGSMQYSYITGATDLSDGTCIARLTLAMPHRHFGKQPPREVYESIIEHSREGLEQDRTVWENLSSEVAPIWLPDDHTVLSFQRYCDGFADG